jgi:hypothetical protein
MFGLVWTNKALDELADIWVSVTPALRDQIELAIHRLDQALQDDPKAASRFRPTDCNRLPH